VKRYDAPMNDVAKEEYEAPTVTDLGRLEDITWGVMGGPTEASNMKT
jgi:hypothetical protein